MTLIRLFLLLTVGSLCAGCATEDSYQASGTGLKGFLSRPVKLEGSYWGAVSERAPFRLRLFCLMPW
jgi:hypothetical protein